MLESNTVVNLRLFHVYWEKMTMKDRSGEQERAGRTSELALDRKE